MKVQATLVSMSKNQTRAMVTVVTGEGAQRRSTTRHINWRTGSTWWGHNPDERAVPLNALYSQELAEAHSNFSVAKATLTRLKEKMLGVENGSAELAETGMSAMDTVMFGDFKTKLAAHIKGAEDSVAIAEAALNEASLKLLIVERDVPLEVQFVGAGLTY